LHYLRGYRDAVNNLYAALSTGSIGQLEHFGPAAAFSDTARHSWGLIATKVDRARLTGQNIRIAVLDTGLDLEHPDFAGRSITHASFIQGEGVQDGNRHGTHCIGTAMGSMQPPTGVRRYGCASGAHIFAGKVLSNAGSGADGGILAGINWAIANQCRIISMSLGSPTRPGETFSTTYEVVAQRALRSNPGTIIIAAAGNSSNVGPGQRREPPNPVGRPANCPSIMAVAALDSTLGIASFSDGGINPDGGGIDIAAPGVNVFSSLPVARGTHGILSGTSMATPHVAGIAALWLEARGTNTSAQELWQILTSTALRLNLLDRDVGAGLVQAPN
jgi:subtilisin family serine protease